MNDYFKLIDYSIKNLKEEIDKKISNQKEIFIF